MIEQSTSGVESARCWSMVQCIVLTIIAAFCLGCSRADQPTVVLYTSADEYVAREICNAFEKETGIRVLLVGDTEAKKTTGLVERLRAEHASGHPQADVYWSSEIFMTIDLADEGILAPYQSETLADWPARFRCDKRHWYGFAARARVIVYAPDRVAEEDIPETWMDLTNHFFRGRIVMADPRFGTTGGHFGAMKAYWDRAYMPGIYSAFLQGLADNEVRLLASGNAGVVRAVAGGEADLGLTDTDDVWAARDQGMNVELVYPRHSREQEPGTGTLLIPNTVGMVAGARNAENAAALIEFLLLKGERIIAQTASRNVPVHDDLGEEFAPYVVPDSLDIDYRRAAAVREAAVQEAMHVLRDEQTGH